MFLEREKTLSHLSPDPVPGPFSKELHPMSPGYLLNRMAKNFFGFP
ncbi:hypothetical protein C900_01665 [Fulvivirga imtechensis AK7]|uniref:Uncharacterized protein n=1 Tax=Fulvivirga imtechensis AK7 TaxID=1237149 RepID=L8JW11_9BACT|nr:hypothetical protein C900_01665 [Fulvivirga imtechensis AK7]